jgi:hypothetical protein
MAALIKTPEGSITLGVAVATLVFGIYTFSTSPTDVIHATKANDDNVERGRKKAAWTAAGTVAAISLLTKDKTIFVLGGAMLIALDWHTRHANATDPATGLVVSNTGYEPADSSNVVPMTDYEPPIQGQGTGY